MEDENKKVKSFNPMGILIFVALAVCIIITCLPSYLSIRGIAWQDEKLPKVFFDISKKYTPDNQGILLSHNYEILLSKQIKRLNHEYNIVSANKMFVPMIDSILKQGKYFVNGKIDTAMILSQIDSTVTIEINSNRSNY